MGASEYKNLLLSSSYYFMLEQYTQMIQDPAKPFWDYIFITAANTCQAEIYEQLVAARQRENGLPRQSSVVVIPDDGGERVGSGGATFAVLRHIAEHYPEPDFFERRKCLLIHSGGDSRRLPQYSLCGKLFMPVPHNDRHEKQMTLFDEILAMTSWIPAKMSGGMLVLAGDVLIFCNPLQIAMGADDAVALLAKEPAHNGEGHGVYVRDEAGFIRDFLHKQPRAELERRGAVDENGDVDIDTGAIILGSRVLRSLFSLISEAGKVTRKRYSRFANSTVALNFYGDFLYPMVREANWEVYRTMPGERPPETAEKQVSAQLEVCREELFAALEPYQIRGVVLSPATFLHLGTSGELLDFLTLRLEDFSCFGWKRCLNTNSNTDRYAVNNALINETAKIGRGAYIENSILAENVTLGRDCIVSHVTLDDIAVPDNLGLHGVLLSDGRYVVRLYPTDNGATLELDWDAPLFPLRDSCEQAARDSLKVYCGQEVFGEKLSMRQSVQLAEASDVGEQASRVTDAVRVHLFSRQVRTAQAVSETALLFRNCPLSQKQEESLLRSASKSDAFLRTRYYYYLSKLGRKEQRREYENLCFETVRQEIVAAIQEPQFQDLRIQRDEVTIRMPLRVNWGGGWSDTPPYCNERGGTVLNAAVSLGGILPVEVRITRLPEPKLVFESADKGIYTEITSLEAVLDCSNPLDDFALHKSAMIALGLLPESSALTLEERLLSFGGGIRLSTAAVGVPQGSGLGTSSILLCACMRGFKSFFGLELEEEEIINLVMRAEQIMNTGGGWQDQVGAMTGGIKRSLSQRGLVQRVEREQVLLSEDTLDELSRRFCLVYTGQRRLARMILRDVMGKYLASETRYLRAFEEIQRLALQMAQTLEAGDVDQFAERLDAHWEYSKLLDESCTNASIERILSVCSDMLDGRMICGAGGGGFLQVVLKRNYTKQELDDRLRSVFPDGDICVYQSEFV